MANMDSMEVNRILSLSLCLSHFAAILYDHRKVAAIVGVGFCCCCCYCNLSVSAQRPSIYLALLCAHAVGRSLPPLTPSPTQQYTLLVLVFFFHSVLRFIFYWRSCLLFTLCTQCIKESITKEKETENRFPKPCMQVPRAHHPPSRHNSKN